MAEMHTLARPYAKAVFQVAKATNSYQEWAIFLDSLATIVTNSQIVQLLKNPMISKLEKANFVAELGDHVFSQEAKALIKLLAEHGRLLLAPEIQALYAQYRAEAEQTITALICSATCLTLEQQEQIHQAVSNYFKKTIICTWTQDPKLIGGFIVKAADEVFDGSIRGQLQALHKELVAH